MTLREFCETALSNDVIGIVEDDIIREEPKECCAAFRYLMNEDSRLDREIDRFTFGKTKIHPHTILIVKLK